MDNKLLDINGQSKELLAKALEIAFAQEGGKLQKVVAFIKSPTHGLILCWAKDSESIPLISPLTHSEILDMVWAYLQTDEAKEVHKEDWEVDPNDGDVSITDGWRIYTEEWGHVNNNQFAICAIKHVYLWWGVNNGCLYAYSL